MLLVVTRTVILARGRAGCEAVQRCQALELTLLGYRVGSADRDGRLPASQDRLRREFRQTLQDLPGLCGHCLQVTRMGLPYMAGSVRTGAAESHLGSSSVLATDSFADEPLVDSSQVCAGRQLQKLSDLGQVPTTGHRLPPRVATPQFQGLAIFPSRFRLQKPPLIRANTSQLVGVTTLSLITSLE